MTPEQADEILAMYEKLVKELRTENERLRVENTRLHKLVREDPWGAVTGTLLDTIKGFVKK